MLNLRLVFSQIEEKSEQLRQETERERDELLKVMDEHKHMAQKSSDKLKQRNLSYQQDLEMQIGYQKTMKTRQKQEELHDYLAGKVCHFCMDISYLSQYLKEYGICVAYLFNPIFMFIFSGRGKRISTKTTERP